MVTMTDGRGKELPLGAREIEDGDRERLGSDGADEDDRYGRVAQQIWKRINETKVT